MLTLTHSAAETIRDLMVGEYLPDHAGLRIAVKLDEPDALEFSLASAPSAGDQVIEERGARVFVEPEAAALVTDKILDTAVEASGRRTLRLTPRHGG